jgi:hydrogenase maturation protease
MNDRRDIGEAVLVIAYGNPLRCDDGVAWQAAEELKRRLPASAQVICVHQLTPELAETVSRAQMVIFIDASNNGEPGEVRCRAVSSQPRQTHLSHHLAPGEVLALCDRLYAGRPPGFLISVHGERFDHGDGISPVVIQAIPRVVESVHRLVKSLAKAAAVDHASPGREPGAHKSDSPTTVS